MLGRLASACELRLDDWRFQKEELFSVLAWGFDLGFAAPHAGLCMLLDAKNFSHYQIRGFKGLKG